MGVRGWVLLWEKALHRRWVVVGLYGFPPPPSPGQALRGNDEWASGGGVGLHNEGKPVEEG